VKAVMSDAGSALMGIGFEEGDHRAMEAAQQAISSPLLETDITGARAVLVNVTAGPDLTLSEVYEAADLIRERTDADDANIIFGTVMDPRLQGAVRITVLATGFDARPAPMKRMETILGRPEPEPTRVPADNDLDIPAFLRRRP
ncbi:MAG: cell division protein FtsZ, partial [bacterium]